MWTLFANELKPDHYWHTSPNVNIAKLYGGKVCAVEFVESAGGQHYGWMSPSQDYPTMIYPNETLFSMCFPYGYKAEEEQNRGKHIRLDAKLIKYLDKSD
jgi:hypothetical protein